MMLKTQVLIGCTALAMALGMAVTATPAAADTQTAHQASKMMRHKPVVLPHRRIRPLPMHHGRMVRHPHRMRHHRPL